MNYQVLFDKLKPVLDDYRKKKEEKREQGSNFNIFRTMRMQHDEVHTHSAVISALLNPNEPHGCKSAFLEAFMSQINVLKEYKDNIDDTSIEVEVEKSIGNVTQDKENGGRLDIFIRFKTKDHKWPVLIIIENKIYARDEEKQLVRYYNYAKKEAERNNRTKFFIFYLSLYGTYSSEISTDNRLESDKDYYPISYRDDIYKWLNICKEIAKDKPLIHGIITQYRDLVATLTNHNMDTTTQENMAKEIVSTYENVFIASAIYDSFDQILYQMCEKKFIPICEKIAQNLDLKLERYGKWNKMYSGVSYKKEKWRFLSVGFEFMKDRFDNFCYGIKYQNNKEKNILPHEYLHNHFNNALNKNGSHGDYWPWYIQDDYPNWWTNEEVRKGLYDGTMENHIRFLLIDIINHIDVIEEQLSTNENSITLD